MAYQSKLIQFMESKVEKLPDVHDVVIFSNDLWEWGREVDIPTSMKNKQILGMLKKEGSMRFVDIVERIKLREGRVYVELVYLEKMGFVKRRYNV